MANLLKRTNDPRVLKAIAENDTVSKATLESVFEKKPPRDVLTAIVNNPNTPKYILRKLAH